MRISVCLKQVLGSGSLLTVDPATPRVVPAESELVHEINPPDLSALELALQLVGVHGGTVTALTLGPSEAEEILVLALARGADSAVHLVTDAELDPPAKGALLAATIRELAPDLILLGDRSQDTGGGQVWAWLAETLALPLITGVVRLWLERGALLTERSLGRGYRQVQTCSLPAVVAVKQGAMQARYVSVHARKRILRESVRHVPVEDVHNLKEDLPPALRVVGFAPHRVRPKRSAAPDPRLSAAERLQVVLQGGILERKGRLVTGAVSDLVVQILAVLQDEGILKRVSNEGSGVSEASERIHGVEGSYSRVDRV